MGGEQLGKYRVLARLGQGGMARVLLTLAEGPHGFNKLLVVKELREELAHDPEFLAMFLDEARITARLNHPNIVQTYEVGNDGDRYYIAMEYLEGQPLNAIFRRVGRKNIPLEVHLKILADVLAGLDHAHRLTDFTGAPLGLVHRDVSPQNVFVTYEGQVKLVDFGIAKAAGASSRTQEGILKGKISYIAPEQARCEPVDARADVFAVGLMLWEALAGRRLVQREDEASVLARRMAGQDPSIRLFVPNVPLEMAAICDRAMAGDPAHRYQSARHLQEVLEDYLSKSDFRVGPKDIGLIVSSAFEDERNRIKKAIEDQVRNLDAVREPIQLELQAPSLRVTSDSLPRVHPGASEPPHANTTALVQTVSGPLPRLAGADPKPARSGSMVLAVAMGAALAVGALAVVAFVGMSGAGPASGTASPATSATPAPATVDLHISYPEGARAALDGQPLTGRPFSAKVPKDGATHRLEVSQDGFEPDERTLTFDRDVRLEIVLTPTLSAASASSEATAAPRTASWPRRPQPAASDPPPPPTTPPAEEEPKRKPPKPATVEIDEQNPYKKAP